MCTVKVSIKWGKFNTSKIATNLADVLLIQNVPVAIVKNVQGLGYIAEFIDKTLPSLKSRKYYQRRETALKHCEKRFGIHYDTLRKIYLK